MSQPEWVVGFHAVLAALERERARVEVVWVAEGLSGARARQLLEAVRAAGVRYASVPRRKLDLVAGSVAHNGTAARLAPAPFADPGALLERAGPLCLLGLDGLEDAHNLGAVVRPSAGWWWPARTRRPSEAPPPRWLPARFRWCRWRMSGR